MDDSGVDIGRAIAASVPAGSAFVVAMWLDNKLSSHQFNDMKLVGQMFTTKSPFWQIMAVMGHYGFSAVMSLFYASWAYYRLPGPGWFRAILLMQIENVVLYPGAGVVERFHAGQKSGQVPTLFSWKSFWGQVVRHIAFGLTLGLLYKPTRKT